MQTSFVPKGVYTGPRTLPGFFDSGEPRHLPALGRKSPPLVKTQTHDRSHPVPPFSAIPAKKLGMNSWANAANSEVTVTYSTIPPKRLDPPLKAASPLVYSLGGGLDPCFSLRSMCQLLVWAASGEYMDTPQLTSQGKPHIMCEEQHK